MKRRLFWLDHAHPEDGSESTQIVSTSYSNSWEISMVVALVSHLVRQGVYQADDIAVVASVPDGTEAAAAAAEFTPDVVLMDYRLPGLDGVQATRAVREASPQTAVVCLTASANLRERDALIEAGAVDCLRKDQGLEAIVEAIRAAAQAAAA